MTSSPWVVAVGAAAFVLGWVLMFAASNARLSSRYAMFAALAGFLLGLTGMLLIAVGTSDGDQYVE